MSDVVSKSRRHWRWLWWGVGLVGLAGAAAAAAIIWLFFIVRQQSAQPGAAAPFLAVGGFVAALAQVLLAWLQLRQGSRAKPGEQLAAHERRERDARDRLRAHLGRQDRLRRMDDPATGALALRVHPAIDLPQPAASSAAASLAAGGLLPRAGHGRPDDARPLDRDLPTFVDRDKGPAICAWMRASRDSGGFLLLVGDSSVGKTRLLYEAAREALGDFTVLAPDLGDGDLINKIAGATLPLPRLIVWLDELQRFLEGPYLTPGSIPITAATVGHLLDCPTPVIIVGTLLPQYAIQLRAGRWLAQSRYPKAVDILDNRRLHPVSLDTFSADERKAAARLASQDPRLKEALADHDYNVTEVLAGAPTLVYRYENATQEQQAVLHAAIDARGLGIQAPLTEQLLTAAARGYLTTVHPDDTWFPPALTELTTDQRPHDHATAPLIPVPNPDHSTVLGYTVADYLLRLTRQRRSTHLSAVTWQTFIDHAHNHHDLFRLAESADHRLLYSYAEPLYRRLTGAGNKRALDNLVSLLTKQGRIDEMIELLQARADAGDGQADSDLANLLAEQGRIDELRARADTGNRYAVELLADLLAEQGRPDELRARADAGDEDAAQLPSLHEQVHTTEVTTRHDDGRDLQAAEQRPAKQDRIEQLFANLRVVNLLAEQGRPDELRARADAGDEYAAHLLVNLLAKQSRTDELRAEVDAGTPHAAERLTVLLATAGETGTADRMRRFGLNPDGSIADRSRSTPPDCSS